jgi:hypothetical protein
LQRITPVSRTLETSQQSIGLTLSQLMSSLVVTLANHSVQQVTGKVKTMSDTYGQTSLTPFAQYDPDTRSWKTSLDTCLWALPMSSLTLPKSGGMRSGELIERPMLALPTGENASSSLPTPKARDHKDATFPPHLWIQNEYDSELPKAIARQFLPTPHAGLGERGRDGVYPNPKDQQDLQHTLATLLPTPTAVDANNVALSPSRYKANRTDTVPHAVAHLLATPQARDWKDAGFPKGMASQEQESLTMLPTPNASDVGKHAGQPRHKREGHQAQLADVLEYLPEWSGVSTNPQSDDGKLF